MSRYTLQNFLPESAWGFNIGENIFQSILQHPYNLTPSRFTFCVPTVNTPGAYTHP